LDFTNSRFATIVKIQTNELPTNLRIHLNPKEQINQLPDCDMRNTHTEIKSEQKDYKTLPLVNKVDNDSLQLIIWR